MRATQLIAAVMACTIMCSQGYGQGTEIDKCFINFPGVKDLQAAQIDKLPESAAGPRRVKTDDGLSYVSVEAGYRVLYFNSNDVPFVNLKVERCSNDLYESDKSTLRANLKYLIANSSGMKESNIIELECGDMKAYGLSRNSIDEGSTLSTLSTFITFPGDDTVIYFYFNNLKQGYRTYESLKEYERQRNKFMKAYSKYLKQCA